MPASLVFRYTASTGEHFWSVAVQSDGVSTTILAPLKKCQDSVAPRQPWSTLVERQLPLYIRVVLTLPRTLVLVSSATTFRYVIDIPT